MIQDISPDRLNNTFCSTAPDQNDYILLFDDDGRLFAKIPDGRICFTTGKDFSAKEAVYLFSVNHRRFFLSTRPADIPLSGFEYRTIRGVRAIGRAIELFAACQA